ncbi:AraC family transcriptional regulator [Chryseobacterium mucoviscidosis]|jgi:AraC-like DNA-binding protein|uniref:AraC family transcriptional regulator n=1 Tax=unclassified Paenibacillus TaxID=185978 RepID=UPI0009A2DBF3|nr:AraC family transcriptional regulator [Paenibacillus sp. 11B]MDN8587175.1 AraC family transcriptional regulator [Paenibacillus sp. 11B]OPG99123.1 AraC family transcriptional regulator [Chryseobacterium mucoviscidosis]
MNIPKGTYGFRFAEDKELQLCVLFAAGCDSITDPSYRWDGLERTDGPLLLFQYTTSGEGVFESKGEIHRVTTGQAFLAEIPGPHRYYYHSKSKEPWEFLFLLFRPNLILPHWQKYLREAGEVPYLPIDGAPVRLLRMIVADAAAGRITDPLIASSCVYQFMTELVRLQKTNLRNRENWSENIQRAAEFIEQNYSRMISMDQLSEHVSLSKYHFIRRFSSSMGLTPGAYLTRIRIEKAMELLRGTPLSVESIAERVGYSSGSYFIKAFRNLTGLTPGEFRSGGESLAYRKLFFD